MMWFEAQFDSTLLSLGGREAVGVGGKGKFEKCILAVSDKGVIEVKLPCRVEVCRGQSAISMELDWLDMSPGRLVDGLCL